MQIRATLFETFHLYTPDGDALDLGSPTTRSLLAYLLLNRHRPSDRRRLAFLFWPNASESAARRNLRQYLHHLRSVLAPLDPEGGLLLASGSTVQFDPQAHVWLDVEFFLQNARPEAELAELQAALALYTGDLLQDLYDEWCRPLRDELRQQYVAGLDRLSLAFQGAGHLDEALKYAAKWAEAEPFDENAQRRLMQLYALKGDRPRAIQVYQNFSRALDEELGVEPLPETQELLASIQNGELAPVTASGPPVPAPHRTRRPAPAPQASPSLLPIIGRDSQLSFLQNALDSAAKGAGRLILVSGEAGIGKTRLLQEFIARHPGTPVLQSACYELESMVPFAPLRQALETSPALASLLAVQDLPPAAASQLAQLAPRLSAALRSPAPAPLDAGGLREAWTGALLLLSQSFPARPLLLIFDDLHWADTPTWELLAALARRAASAPLLVIGLCRMEDLSAERRTLLRTVERSGLLTRMDLPRLTPEQTTDLALVLSPDRAGDTIFTKRLYHDTHGNPFFIIETVRAIQESGRQMQPSSFVNLPVTIQRVIEARLDRLPEASREALTAAAAIGRAFSFALLQEIGGLSAEDCVAFIEEWQARGLIDEAGQGYDFRHDQFRQAAYASLSQARRQYLHGRIASVLEETIPPADAATLAHHFSRSDQPLKALPYLTRAGQQALRLRSYHEARQFGLQAVGLLGQLPGPRQRSERVDINLQLAQAYAFTGDLARAIEILDETGQLAHALEDQPRLGQIYRRFAQFFWLRGQPEIAGDHARRTLRLAEDLGSPELHFAALRMLGRVGIALAAFDDAIAYLNRYVSLHDEMTAAGKTAGLPDDIPVVLGYLGVAYTRVGAWERALDSARRGLELAEGRAAEGLLTTTVVFARMQLAMVHAGLRAWGECRSVLDPLPDPVEMDEITPAVYMALSLRGYAQAHSGDPAKGCRTLRTAIQWAAQKNYRVFQYLPRLFLARCLLLDRQVDAAQAEALEALEQAEKVGNRWAEGIGQQLLADICTQQHNPDWPQIESRLIRSMQLLRAVRARPDLAHTYLSLRRLYDRAGQIAWAVDCHFRATTIFEELGMTGELRLAQGQAGGERRGAVVIPNLPLKGPNVGGEDGE
ncbi:MAG: AAA family ATPase [Chloroflexota bacterium]